MKTEQNLKTAIEQKKNEIAEAILSGLPKVVIDALEAELKTLKRCLMTFKQTPRNAAHDFGHTRHKIKTPARCGRFLMCGFWRSTHSRA